MRTIEKIFKKILFGRAFGGLEWHHVATLRDRLVKKSQATPEADDDLPGIEYLGWMLARRSLARALLVSLATSIATILCLACLYSWHGLDFGTWSRFAPAAASIVTFCYTMAVRRTFLAEANKEAPLGGYEQRMRSFWRAEAAILSLRRQSPLCFWTLAMRTDAGAVVQRQLEACDRVRAAELQLSEARTRVQLFAEPATPSLARLEAGCAKIWPDVALTLRLFDPGPIEGESENAIIDGLPPSGASPTS
jgi:hypothetical protein